MGRQRDSHHRRVHDRASGGQGLAIRFGTLADRGTDDLVRGGFGASTRGGRARSARQPGRRHVRPLHRPGPMAPAAAAADHAHRGHSAHADGCFRAAGRDRQHSARAARYRTGGRSGHRDGDAASGGRAVVAPCRNSASLVSADRHRGRMPGRRPVRGLRQSPRVVRCSVAWPSRPRTPGTRCHAGRRVLGTAAVVLGSGPRDRCQGHRRRHRYPTPVLAKAASHGLPCGSGIAQHHRDRHPAVGPRRHSSDGPCGAWKASG